MTLILDKDAPAAPATKVTSRAIIELRIAIPRGPRRSY
jgi:hypothetical protein